MIKVKLPVKKRKLQIRWEGATKANPGLKVYSRTFATMKIKTSAPVKKKPKPEGIVRKANPGFKVYRCKKTKQTIR